jgi:hypothetical protein
MKDPLPLHTRLVIGVHACHEAAGPAQLRCQLVVEKFAYFVAKGRIG